MKLEDRQALVESDGITLDGQKAKITGYRNEFASVVMVSTGYRIEFAWETAARIVANGGAFRS